MYNRADRIIDKFQNVNDRITVDEDDFYLLYSPENAYYIRWVNKHEVQAPPSAWKKDPVVVTLIIVVICMFLMGIAMKFVETQKRRIFQNLNGMHTLRVRSAALGMPLEEHMDAGRISVRSVDPAELAPGEFAHAVRHAVEDGGAQVVIIDSLNGYHHAMPDEQFITLQLHELLTFSASRASSPS